MRQILLEGTDPELGSHLPQLRLSPLAIIVFVLLVGFTMVDVGIRPMAQYISSPSNPFSDYADVFPGKSASAISSRAFSRRSNEYYYQDTTEESCTLMLTTGVFFSVQVIISDGIIRESIFLIRDNSRPFLRMIKDRL